MGDTLIMGSEVAGKRSKSLIIYDFGRGEKPRPTTRSDFPASQTVRLTKVDLSPSTVPTAVATSFAIASLMFSLLLEGPKPRENTDALRSHILCTGVMMVIINVFFKLFFMGGKSHIKTFRMG